MDPEYWWLIAGILLFLIEIFTPSFFAASLGLGAFFASGAAFLAWPIEIQVLIFALVSVTSIFVFRPLIKKYLYRTEELPTNADALIGKMGIVVQPMLGSSSQGRVAIDGDEWQFIMAQGTEQVAKGDRVRVVGRNSIILTVELL
jgi:membrane protein implicated in regulation of membrane protease activity